MSGPATGPTGWRETLAEYLRSLEHLAWSPASIASTRKALERFFEWVGLADEQSVADVAEDAVDEYRHHLATARSLRGTPFSLGTQRVYLRGVRRFFAWAERRGLVLVSPAARIEPPRAPAPSIGSILDEQGMVRLLAAPDLTTPIGVRDRAILELMYSTGARVGEVAGLALFDVDLAGGLIRIRRGKGDKGRLAPIGRAAVRFLSEYITQVRATIVGRKRTVALFVGRGGRPATVKVIQHLVRRHAETAGVKASPHAIRRSATTHMLAAGASPEILMEMLGHASGHSLRYYARLYGPDLKAEHRRAHPRERDDDPEYPLDQGDDGDDDQGDDQGDDEQG